MYVRVYVCECVCEYSECVYMTVCVCECVYTSVYVSV